MWGISEIILEDGQLFIIYGHGGASGMASSFRVWDDVDPDSSATTSLWNGGAGTTISGSLGSATFHELIGATMDDQYFYLSDKNGSDYTIYVWERTSTDFYASNPDPAFTIAIGPGGFISSDGEHLFINNGAQIWYYPVKVI